MLKIIGWDLYSPFGGKSDFVEAVSNYLTIDDFRKTNPFKAMSYNIPDFDVREQLGKKGTRNFDRHTGLFVKTLCNVIDQCELETAQLSSVGLINATSTGSLDSIMDFLLDTYRYDRPYLVNPAHMPNTVINCAAGQGAIWNGMKGPNATVSAGSQSFYSALRLASRWGENDYSPITVVGAVEEVTETVDKLYSVYKENTHSAELIECSGSIVVKYEVPSELNEYDSYILSTRLGVYHDPKEAKSGLVSLLTKLLEEEGINSQDIEHFCIKSSSQQASYDAEESAAKSINSEGKITSIADCFGNAYSASGVLQLSYLLTALPAKRYGVLISLSKNGSMACSLIYKGQN